MSNIHGAGWAYYIGLVLGVVAYAGCDGPQGTSAATCAVGTESCACYPNGTCNGSLTCASNLCVNLSAAGGASAASSSGGQSTATDAGGATSTVGGATAVGQGGTAVVGSGGTSAVGQGGTAVVGIGGATATGSGGTTLSATGGTTNVGIGGAMLPGVGGAVATGGAIVTGSGGVPTGPNLIKNGDFSSGGLYWSAEAQDGDGTIVYSSGAACVTNLSTSVTATYLSFSLGYPATTSDAFVLEAGSTYTFSYQVKGSYVRAFEAKIGQAISPWTTDYSVMTDLVTTSYKAFSHQFTTATGDTTAGLVFNVELYDYGEMCFANVSVKKN